MDKNKSAHQVQTCHLVQDLFPPTLDTPVNSPPSISNLLDLSLPSDLNLHSNPLLETNFSGEHFINCTAVFFLPFGTNFMGLGLIGLLTNSANVPSSPPPASPSTILKEDENQWLNSEVK